LSRSIVQPSTLGLRVSLGSVCLCRWCFYRGEYFRFGLIFIEKSNQNEFFVKKNQNRTETGSNRPVSVWFGFLGQKPVQTGLTRFFPFFVGFGSVPFFGFLLIKPNRPGFSKI
jgi:hypothetical protein